MPITNGTSSNSAREESLQISQEIRFEQQRNQWQWHAGLYFSQEETDRDENYDLTGLVRLLGLESGLTPETPGYADYVSTSTVLDVAAFGNLRWSLAADWNLTFGVRFDDIRKQIDLDVSGGDPLGLLVDDSNDFSIQDKRNWTEPSWSLGLDHHLTRDLMLYALVNTGFKAGNFNSVSTSPQSALASSDPEHARNRELGLKGFFLQKRLQLNAALFQMDYQDLQVFTRRDSESNAPAASIEGAEFEWRARINGGLELGAGYQWLETRFDEYVSPAGENLAGNELTRAPQHAATAALNYTWSDASQRRWWLVWDGAYTGSLFINPENTPGSKVPSHTSMNLALQLRPANGPVEYSAWIRNLTNEHYAWHVIDQSTFSYTTAGSAW